MTRTLTRMSLILKTYRERAAPSTVETLRYHFLPTISYYFIELSPPKIAVKNPRIQGGKKLGHFPQGFQ